MSSDHITPWSMNQGQSGFTWAWLGAVMQATKSLPFGSLAIPRLKAGVNIMRALWRGETVTGDYGSIKTDHARLWSLPDPRILSCMISKTRQQ